MFIDINIYNLNNISNLIYITNDTLKNNNHLIISRPFLPTILIDEIKNILENRKDDIVVLEVVEEVKEEKKIIVTLEDKPTKERKKDKEKDKEKDKIEKKVIKNNIENENDKDKIEKQVIKNNEEKDKDKNKTKEKEQCNNKVIDNDSDEDESIVSINSLSNIKGSLDKKEIESLKKRLIRDHIKVEPKTTNFDFEAELNDLIDNTILDLNGVNHK